jgi:predicted MFS family arabinose efflux permease
MLTDRYDYRALLTGFTALLACGALLMASASSLWQGCFFFAVAGLGHAACWAPVAALVQKWVPDHRRGAALSVVNMGLGLGIPLWSTLLPLIVAAADWRAGWVAMGLFGLGVAAVNFTLVRSPVNTGTAKDGAVHGGALMGGSYRKILADRGFWIIGTAYLFVGFNVLVPFAFLPIYATESLGLPYTAATRFVATIALFRHSGSADVGHPFRCRWSHSRHDVVRPHHGIGLSGNAAVTQFLGPLRRDGMLRAGVRCRVAHVWRCSL